MKKLVILSAFFTSVVSYAGLQQDFMDLKDRGRNLQDTGAICEEVAALQIQRQYGSGYLVLSGIEYSDRDGTVGELDVVVFEKSTGQAVLVSEVKCWKDLASGLRKALEQRKRFIQYVSSRQELHFRWKENPSLKLTKQQFNKTNQFTAISQKGGKSRGYEFELPYSLVELMELRDKIQQCQSRGACQRPLH